MAILISTAGNIGAGKTTLAKWLGNNFNLELNTEVVNDNRYLSDYYSDFNSYAFRLAIHFLSLRASQLLKASASLNGSVIDRSIYEDPEIFVRKFNDEKIIEKRDYDTYFDLWNLIHPHLPKLDILIYLYCPVDVLLKRIKKRGRSYEQSISVDFLNTLQNYYNEWINKFNLCKIIKVDSANLSYTGGEEIEKLKTEITEYIRKYKSDHQ